jgi:hypothetical protein
MWKEKVEGRKGLTLSIFVELIEFTIKVTVRLEFTWAPKSTMMAED